MAVVAASQRRTVALGEAGLYRLRCPRGSTRSLEQLGRRALAAGAQERSECPHDRRAASYLHTGETRGLKMRDGVHTRVEACHTMRMSGLWPPDTQTAAIHARAWLQTCSEHKWKSRRRPRRGHSFADQNAAARLQEHGFDSGFLQPRRRYGRRAVGRVRGRQPRDDDVAKSDGKVDRKLIAGGKLLTLQGKADDWAQTVMKKKVNRRAWPAFPSPRAPRAL